MWRSLFVAACVYTVACSAGVIAPGALQGLYNIADDGFGNSSVSNNLTVGGLLTGPRASFTGAVSAAQVQVPYTSGHGPSLVVGNNPSGVNCGLFINTGGGGLFPMQIMNGATNLFYVTSSGQIVAAGSVAGSSLSVSGAASVQGALTTGNTLTVSGTTITMNNGGSNMLLINTTAGVGAPTTPTRSAGTKIVLSPTLSSSGNVDYAIGISSARMWHSVPTGSSFGWYGGTSPVMTLDSSGNLTVTGNLNVSGNTVLGNSAGDTVSTYHSTLEDGFGNASIANNLVVGGALSAATTLQIGSTFNGDVVLSKQDNSVIVNQVVMYTTPAAFGSSQFVVVGGDINTPPTWLVGTTVLANYSTSNITVTTNATSCTFTMEQAIYCSAVGGYTGTSAAVTETYASPGTYSFLIPPVYALAPGYAESLTGYLQPALYLASVTSGCMVTLDAYTANITYAFETTTPPALVVGSSLNVTNALTAASATVTGNLTAGNATLSNNLAVGGTLTASTNVNVAGPLTSYSITTSTVSAYTVNSQAVQVLAAFQLAVSASTPSVPSSTLTPILTCTGITVTLNALQVVGTVLYFAMGATTCGLKAGTGLTINGAASVTTTANTMYTCIFATTTQWYCK